MGRTTTNGGPGMIRTAVRTMMATGVVAAVAVGGVAIGQQMQGSDPAPEPASQSVDVATTGPQVVEPGATLEAKPRHQEPAATATTSTAPATVAATVDDDPAATTQEQTVTSPEPTTAAAEPTQSAAPTAEQTTAAADPSVPPTGPMPAPPTASNQ